MLPQGCVLILLLLPKELFWRVLIAGKHFPSRLLPLHHPVPCITTTRSCLGRLGSARLIHSLVLNIASSEGEEGQLFSSYPEITLSPSFACDETPLSVSKIEMQPVSLEGEKGSGKRGSCVMPTAAFWFNSGLRDVFFPLCCYQVDCLLFSECFCSPSL